MACSLRTVFVIGLLVLFVGCREGGEKDLSDAGISDARVHDMDGEAAMPDAGADASMGDAASDTCPSGFVCDCTNGANCPETDDPCLMVGCDYATSGCAYTPLDNDGDGHAPLICSSIGGDDCNDANAEIHPGAKEVCDGADNDCDGQIDENLPDCG